MCCFRMYLLDQVYFLKLCGTEMYRFWNDTSILDMRFWKYTHSKKEFCLSNSVRTNCPSKPIRSVKSYSIASSPSPSY